MLCNILVKILVLLHSTHFSSVISWVPCRYIHPICHGPIIIIFIRFRWISRWQNAKIFIDTSTRVAPTAIRLVVTAASGTAVGMEPLPPALRGLWTGHSTSYGLRTSEVQGMQINILWGSVELKKCNRFGRVNVLAKVLSKIGEGVRRFCDDYF